MNELKTILALWLMSNYTGLWTFRWAKCGFTGIQLRISVYKGVIHPWMKSILPRLLLSNSNLVKSCTFWKWLCRHTTLGFPFSKRSSPMNEIIPSILEEYDFNVLEYCHFWFQSASPFKDKPKLHGVDMINLFNFQDVSNGHGNADVGLDVRPRVLVKNKRSYFPIVIALQINNNYR